MTNILNQLTITDHRNLVLVVFLIIVTIGLLFVGLSGCSKGKEKNITEGDVEIVLFERNPWAMLIGGESPIFVKYKDGLTIYKNKNKYYYCRLNKDEEHALLQVLQINEKIFACKRYIV